MGAIVQAECTGCGLLAELYVGGGMRDCNPETAQTIAANEPDFLNALEMGVHFRIERRVSACEHCRKLVTAARVIYQRPGEPEHIVAPRCPDCGNRLLWPTEEPVSISCPVCGQAIPLLSAGHWD